MILGIIGLALGAFIGLLLADVTSFLDPARVAIKAAVEAIREKVVSLVKGVSNGNLIAYGIIALVVLLFIWWISFSTAVLLGVIGGIVYSDKVENIPLVSALATTVKDKIKGLTGGASSVIKKSGSDQSDNS